MGAWQLKRACEESVQFMEWLEKWNPIQLLSPKICLKCGEASNQPLCGPCLSQLEPIAGKGCRTCGNPLVHRDAEGCQWCSRLSLLPEDICTLFAYRNMGRDLYHLVKYDGYWPLIEPILRSNLAGFFKSTPFLQYRCLAPVPESFSRKLKRHFNPAAVLARVLSECTGLPVHEGLKMNMFQRHQVGLGYEERQKNTQNRFTLKGDDPPPSVILVDDVLTTGATLEAATRTLNQGGVQKVAWFTLFRTI